MVMTKKKLLIFIIGCMQKKIYKGIYIYIYIYIIYIDAEIKYQLTMCKIQFNIFN